MASFLSPGTSNRIVFPENKQVSFWAGMKSVNFTGQSAFGAWAVLATVLQCDCASMFRVIHRNAILVKQLDQLRVLLVRCRCVHTKREVTGIDPFRYRLESDCRVTVRQFDVLHVASFDLCYQRGIRKVWVTEGTTGERYDQNAG